VNGLLASILSKVSVVVLPAFLLLLDAVPPGKGRRPSIVRAVPEKIPYGVVGAARERRVLRGTPHSTFSDSA
jgi:hypothetical protein